MMPIQNRPIISQPDTPFIPKNPIMTIHSCEMTHQQQQTCRKISPRQSKDAHTYADKDNKRVCRQHLGKMLIL
jgi:hypothetical protein